MNTETQNKNEQQPAKIGIISGGGVLPVILAEECQRQGVPFFMIGLDGSANPDDLKPFPHCFSRIGAVGNTMKQLAKQDCTHVVMAGSVSRPALSQIVPDVKGAMLLAKLFRKGRLGDDGLLRELANEIESEGFFIVGAHEIAPKLLADEGNLTRYKPSKQAAKDLKDGLDILIHMEGHDIGQAIAMQEGLVLGVEAIEGTAELIQRCGVYARKGNKPVLIKRKKAMQDTRFDMPTIGEHTIDQLVESGFAGMYIEANSTLVLNKERVIEKANEHHLFIVGFNSHDE